MFFFQMQAIRSWFLDKENKPYKHQKIQKIGFKIRNTDLSNFDK